LHRDFAFLPPALTANATCFATEMGTSKPVLVSLYDMSKSKTVSETSSLRGTAAHGENTE